jgi:hypothetical protein
MTVYQSLRAALSMTLLSVIGSSCGGGGAERHTTPPVTVPPGAAAPWEVRALFGYGQRGLVDVDGEGVRFVADGVRVQVEGSDVRFAAEHVFDPFRCSRRVGAGYVFITESGALYTAAEFLGPLTLRRPSGPRVTSCLVSRGVMVLEEGHNDLLFVGLEGETWRAPEALRGQVVDAAFRDLRHGIVVVAPGVALLTRDNVTYAPLDFGGRTVVAAWPEADRWVVQTTDGWFAVDDAGQATALADPPDAARPPLSDALLARVFAAAQARQPAAFTDTLPGPDGRLLVRLAEDDDEGEPVDVSTATWSPGGGLRSLDAPRTDCDVLEWGGRGLANCPDAIHVQDDAAGWRTLGPSVDARIVTAADGSTFATLDECDGEHRRAAQLTCGRTLRVHDGEGWRTRTLDERVDLLDVHGRHVLVRTRRTRAVQLLSMDSAAGDRTLSMPEPFTRLFLHFDAGGGIWGSAWGATEGGVTPTIAVYAPPGEALAEVSLPEEAFGFEMADGRHGMAVGDALDEVWVTSDGARSWERLALPGAGDVGGLELPVNERGGTSPVLQCSALACRVHYTWVWGAPSVVASMDRASFVHVPSGEAESSAPLSWRADPAPAQPVVHCELPAYRDEGAWSSRARRTTGFLGVDGEQLRWAFHARGRAFEAVSGELSSAPIGVEELSNGALEPLLVTPRFALFDHRTQPMDSDEPDPDLEGGALRVVRAGGEPEPLELPVPDGLRVYVAALHPLPRGHSAVHFVSTRGDEVAHDIVAELDADGTVVRSRVYVLPPRGHVRWLAVDGPVPGLLVGGPGRAALSFHPVDGSTAAPVPPPEGAVARLCGRTGGGLSVVATDGLGPRLAVSTEESRFYSPVLRLDGDASCLLGFQPRPAAFWTSEPWEEVPRWLSFELQRGTLRVRVSEPGSDPSQAIACAPPAAPSAAQRRSP